MDRKKTLTTGEIAKHCGVEYQTVIRWIDQGLIKGFRLPRRGDRRVPVAEFLRFLRESDIPIPEEYREDTLRVLIVEDEAPLAQAMSEVLTDAGCEIAVAHDGFSAGQMLETFSPAVMTLDLNMPGINGFEVIRRVRAQEHLGDLRILVVSGLPEADLDKAVELGADATIAKPFKIGDLAEEVTKLAGLEESVRKTEASDEAGE